MLLTGAQGVKFGRGLDTPSGNFTTEWVRIDTSGNVGIGTTAPSERLDVQGNVRFSGALMPGGNPGTSGQVLVSQGQDQPPVWQTLPSSNNSWSLTGNSGTNPANNFLGTTDNQPLVFRTNNSERVRIDTNGNVGIGTTTPGAKLHVIDGDGINRATQIGIGRFENDASIPLYQLQTADNDINFGQDALFIYGSRWGNSVWFVRGSSGGDRAYARIWNPGTSASNLSLFDASALTGGNENVRLSSSGNSWFLGGNVGIGTTAPANALHVSRFGFNPSQNDAAAIRVEGNWGGGIVFSEGNNRSAIYSPSGSDLIFATGGSSGGIPGRVHIDSIGRVGVNNFNWLNATLAVFTPSSHIDNSPLSNSYLRTFGMVIDRGHAVDYLQNKANNSSSISAFRQEALFVVNLYSTSAKTFMNAAVMALTEGPNPNHPNVGLLGLCETYMCLQTGPMNPQGQPQGQGNSGSPMIDNPSTPTNTFVGLGCVYDLAQVPNDCRPFFIRCNSSDNPYPNQSDAGHFLVHARGHMQLFSPAGAVAYKNGSSTWDAISDARLKTNIRPITGALEKIGQLRGVSFDWINQDLHKGDPTSGFLAQEMEKVFPDCVNEVDSPAGDNADSKLTGGKIKTVGLTSGFFATMVEAIKEQQQIIEGLQKTVAQQQQLIDLQNQKIAQLEQKLEELANKLGS